MHTLLAQFTDIHGVAKGKLVPLAHLDELLDRRRRLCRPVDRRHRPAAHRARAPSTTRAATPAPRTPCPGCPACARIVCDGFVNGQPFDACPRQVLKRAVARLAERGWHLRTGIEPEFFLLRRDGERWLPADDAGPARQAVLRPEVAGAPAGLPARAAVGAVEACGLDVLQIDHEDAHGQYEVNFGFDEALASADHLMLFKLAAQALAEAHGMVFSMMPKPFADQPGSGMHFHVSLWSDWNPKRPDNAHNVFVPHRSDGSADRDATLSPIGRHFIAGVLAHSAALTRAGRAHRQLLQAAARRRIAVGHQLGAGLRGAGPEQPHGARCARCTAASSGACPTPAPTPTWPRPR